MFWKKRKTVSINIEVPEVVPYKKTTGNAEDYYREGVIAVVNEHSLSECPDLIAKKKTINDDFALFNKRKADILQWYFIFKLFLPSVKKDDRFNTSKLNLDKDVNSLKRTYEEVNRRVRKMNSDERITDFDCEEIYASINNLYDFSRDINKKINSFKADYFNSLKVSSLTITKEKNYEELEKLSNAVEDVVIKFGGIEKAKDYIVYHSGELISEVIDLFVLCLKESSNARLNKINYHYFLESDFALALSLNDWINLFNKFRYVYRYTQEANEIDLLRLNKKYRELEVNFVILLIANEIESKRNEK